MKNNSCYTWCFPNYYRHWNFFFVIYMNEELMNGCRLFSQVHFNLQLSEKERIDRARVVLPFEHQGLISGRSIFLYCKIILTWVDLLSTWLNSPSLRCSFFFSVCSTFDSYCRNWQTDTNIRWSKISYRKQRWW